MDWSKRLRKLQTWWRVSSSQPRLVAESWLAMSAAKVLLRTPLRARVLASRTVRSPAKIPVSVVLEAFEQAAFVHVRPVTCLERSVALREVLRCYGIAAELRVGVRKEGAALRAHAWLEGSEIPVETGTEAFSTLHDSAVLQSL